MNELYFTKLDIILWLNPVYMGGYIDTYIWVCVHIYVYIYIHMHAYMAMCMYMFIYIHVVYVCGAFNKFPNFFLYRHLKLS